MAPTLSAWQGALLAFATWLCIHMQNDFGPVDGFLPPSSVNTSVEEHYSDTYYQARALFRERAAAAGAALHALPVVNLEHLGLTVDVAVIHGAKDRVVVHMSGTHGVEGFAGSAIQSAILLQQATAAAKKTKEQQATALPTVVLVHAVNPYGFATLRRFNENNVDLNRNWLSEAHFKTLTARDPNEHGYMDVNQLLNPTIDSLAWQNWFWPRAAFEVATKGSNKIKQAAVTGNYNMPASIYYGGDQLQPSLAALKAFLIAHVDFANVKKLAVVDVHTGLGKSGEDTLMIMPTTTKGSAARVFHQEFRANRAAAMDDPTNPVAQGYETVVGLVADGVAELLPSTDKCDVISIVQEFGTVPGVFVLKATAQENAFYQHAPSRRLPYAERLRDVFYTHGSVSWKESVLLRGVTIINKLTEHLSTHQ